MKVKCKIDLYDGRGLVKGKIYDVQSVEKEWYRIVCELGEDYLFPPELFEIVEGHPETTPFFATVQGAREAGKN